MEDEDRDGEWELTGRESGWVQRFGPTWFGVEHHSTNIFAKRTDAVIDAAAGRAGIGRDELGARLGADEALADVLYQAIDRGRISGDEDYLSLMGRLVGAACDDARVDEVAFQLAHVAKLEPLHLRVLMLACDFAREEVRGDVVRRVRCAPGDAETFRRLDIDGEVVYGVFNDLSSGVISQVLTGLVTAGLLEVVEVQHPGRLTLSDAYRLTSAADRLVETLFRAAVDYDPDDGQFDSITPPEHPFAALKKLYPPRDYRPEIARVRETFAAALEAPQP